MLARGFLHVHSTLSHDGKLSLSEISEFMQARGYHFVCISEHSQDLDESCLRVLREGAARASSKNFCMIPGIEFSCSSLLHIVGAGCTELLDVSDPAALALQVRELGGFAVLAHPSRIQWDAPDKLIRAMNAIEAWNVLYDGKCLPAVKGLDFFNRAKAINPEVLATCGLDLHDTGGFYPAVIELTLPVLDARSVLEQLVAGNYRIESPLWSADARECIPASSLSSVRAIRPLLDRAGRGRDLVLVYNTHPKHAEQR